MKNIKTFEAFSEEFDAKLNEEVINEAQTVQDSLKEILTKKPFIPHIYKTKAKEIKALGFDNKSNFKNIIQQGMKNALTDDKEKALYKIFYAQAEAMTKKAKEGATGTIAGGGYAG